MLASGIIDRSLRVVFSTFNISFEPAAVPIGQRSDQMKCDIPQFIDGRNRKVAVDVLGLFELSLGLPKELGKLGEASRLSIIGTFDEPIVFHPGGTRLQLFLRLIATRL